MAGLFLLPTSYAIYCQSECKCIVEASERLVDVLLSAVVVHMAFQLHWLDSNHLIYLDRCEGDLQDVKQLICLVFDVCRSSFGTQELGGFHRVSCSLQRREGCETCKGLLMARP